MAHGKAVDKRMIYFVQDHAKTGIKIGIATDPLRRLFNLQTAHPYPLLPLGSCQGDAALERTLHKEFSEDRLLGEWFRPSERLLARIEALCRDHVQCLATHEQARGIVKA